MEANPQRFQTAPGVPALTGVRALACVWVVLSHIAQHEHAALPEGMLRLAGPGFLGIDVFFILSGFVLPMAHPGLPLRARPLAGFALKRLWRVYPLDVAVMLALLLRAWALGMLGPGWFEPRYFLPVLLMVQPYTDPPIVGWLATNWSVGIELACYGAFPLLALFLRRLPAVPLAALLVCLLLAEAATQRVWLAHVYGVGALARGGCGFMLGVAGFACVERFGLPARRWLAAAEVAVITATLMLLWTGALWAVPVCLSLLILCLPAAAGPVGWLTRRPVVVWLGEISYSIYLVHGVVLGSGAWRGLDRARAAWPDPWAFPVPGPR